MDAASGLPAPIRKSRSFSLPRVHAIVGTSLVFRLNPHLPGKGSTCRPHAALSGRLLKQAARAWAVHPGAIKRAIAFENRLEHEDRLKQAA